MANVMPPNLYALRFARARGQSSPSKNTLVPNTSTCGPKWLATSAPTIAPSAVPRMRCQESVSAAPNDDYVITRVVRAAQYVSGRRNKRATSTEATAATAVRAECTSITQPTQPTGPCLSPAIFFLHHPPTVTSCIGPDAYTRQASVQKNQAISVDSKGVLRRLNHLKSTLTKKWGGGRSSSFMQYLLSSG